MEILKKTYEVKCQKSSDINEHLPTLKKYANECQTIFETGVRGVVSSWALLLGLVENNKENKFLYLNDISPCKTSDLENVAKQVGVEIKSQWKNNLTLEFEENQTFDLVFIDTWHVYAQLKRELAKFSQITNKYIIMHDTTVDEIRGETIRCGMNVDKQVKMSGFPKEEILKGLGPAITEFLEENKNWKLKEKFTNNNGLTVLERIS
jgi:hypothetical protein